MLNVLTFSLDPKILERDSAVQKRQIAYSNLCDELHIMAFGIGQNYKINNIYIYPISGSNKLINFFKAFALAKKIIKKNKINLITAQDQYYIGFLATMLAKKFKIGLEIQVHGFEKFSGLRKVVAKYVLLRATAVRTVSQRLKRRLVQEFEVSEDKITVVPVHVKVRSKKYEVRSMNENKFVFLTIGRLVPVKNIEMQIKAMAKIVGTQNFASINKNVELWIVGDGPERGNLEFGIRNLGLGDNVKLLGWQDNIHKFYEQADVFLLTSHSEGWPLVIIEAASYGLPIVMTDIGSAGELIKDKENGLVIPVGDQAALEQAMINLMENSELRNKIGAGARKTVENLPNQEEILNLYKKSWQKALKP